MNARHSIRLAVALALAMVACLAATAVATGAELGDRKLERGMKGNDVAELQSVLTDLELETQVDGHFGESTESNLERYEERESLSVNGVLSKCQAADMLREARGESDPPADWDASRLGERKLGCGDSGADVERLQRLLTKVGIDTPETGYFGKETEASVEADERQRGFSENGTVSTDHARDLKQRAKRILAPGEHAFPVDGPHGYGGAGSRFGAPRSGHTHRGQDIAAAQGTRLVSVHDGVVNTTRYQAGGAGFYVVIRGDDGFDSVYMHMREAASVQPGQRVRAGERIGYVGSTGSSTGPHLHFELWTPHWFAGGEPFDPLPSLLAWDEQS